MKSQMFLTALCVILASTVSAAPVPLSDADGLEVRAPPYKGRDVLSDNPLYQSEAPGLATSSSRRDLGKKGTTPWDLFTATPPGVVVARSSGSSMPTAYSDDTVANDHAVERRGWDVPSDMAAQHWQSATAAEKNAGAAEKGMNSCMRQGLACHKQGDYAGANAWHQQAYEYAKDMNGWDANKNYHVAAANAASGNQPDPFSPWGSNKPSRRDLGEKETTPRGLFTAIPPGVVVARAEELKAAKQKANEEAQNANNAQKTMNHCIGQASTCNSDAKANAYYQLANGYSIDMNQHAQKAGSWSRLSGNQPDPFSPWGSRRDLAA